MNGQPEAQAAQTVQAAQTAQTARKTNAASTLQRVASAWRRPPRLHRPTLVLMTLLLLSACKTSPPANAPATMAAAPGEARSAPAAALKPLPGEDMAPPAVAKPRTFASVQALMEARKVTGLELVSQLSAVRKLMGEKRSTNAVKSLVGAPDDAHLGSGIAPGTTPGAAGIDLQAEMKRQALRGLEDMAKPYLASIGFGALDNHMKGMIDDPRMLAAETVTLPSPKGMTQAQMQRAVNMAAMLVATRVTGKVLRKAKDDFASVEAEYSQLIERREKAAEVLFGVLVPAAGQSPELAGLFSSDDLRYLRSVRSMSVKDFSNDLGAQNLALRYLRKTDPTAWADYKGRSDGLLGSTRGYIRTAAGVTAFAALVASFGKETVAAFRSKDGGDILVAAPLIYAFASEALPVLKTSWDAGAAGIVELPMKATRRFRVVDGAASVDVSSASDVFKAMKQGKAEQEFKDALFRTGTDGLLYKVYRCDKSEAGRMLDVAVSGTEREKFAAKYVPGNIAHFSFQNAFNAPADNLRERELADELLRLDHRQRSTTPAFGIVQRVAVEGAAKWNSDQLLRLILANREGAAAQATLQLGGVTVRPVPNMASVYAYESLVNQCSQQFAGDPVPASVVPAVPVKPGLPSKPGLPAKPALPANLPRPSI